MLIHWCLKGIAELGSFDDAAAQQALVDGLKSNWLRANGGNTLDAEMTNAQNALGSTALDDHVNNYWAVCGRTPYLSMSAGSVSPSAHGGVSVRPAWRTALDFATLGGRSAGYVFRCWTVVSPKPNAGLFHMSDEVRELNIYRQFWIFHTEGEIAVPILLPARQIAWVQKFDANLQLDSKFGFVANQDFVEPENLGNILEEVQ